MEIKIEVGSGGCGGGWGLWNDDDEERAMVMEVLGTHAFDYLVANSFTNESMLMAIGSGENP